MKAVQLVEFGAPGKLLITDLPEPQPSSNEVLVKVHACGLNHLDLWLEKGALPIELRLPIIPGAEIAGEVLALGNKVHGWQVGDRVAVQSNLFCGECEFCLAGKESLCLHGQLLGVQRDGGFAEKVVVPARALVSLPDGLNFQSSAALTLAGSTAVHMLTSRVQVQSGQWVLVMAGASGVGSVAIQVARYLGAYVIATGSTPAKRELATKLGAEYVVDSSKETWPSQVRQITQKHGADLVIEHVGGKTFERVFDCLARGGTILTCGATTGPEVHINLWPLFVKEQRVIGSYGRNRKDLETTLEWARQGIIRPVIDRVLPLSATTEAFNLLRARGVLGKILIQP
jgi:2-desacetyl-2-hydroxyethyl bacteriochlorophyllide A dehydrogenase